MACKYPHEVLATIPQDQVNKQNQQRAETDIPRCSSEHWPHVIHSEEVDKVVLSVTALNIITATVTRTCWLDWEKGYFVICVITGRKFDLQSKSYSNLFCRHHVPLKNMYY